MCLIANVCLSVSLFLYIFVSRYFSLYFLFIFTSFSLCVCFIVSLHVFLLLNIFLSLSVLQYSSFSLPMIPPAVVLIFYLFVLFLFPFLVFSSVLFSLIQFLSDSLSLSLRKPISVTSLSVFVCFEKALQAS